MLFLCKKYFYSITMAIIKKGNGEREMRLTVFREILHSALFEGAEFIDHISFL